MSLRLRLALWYGALLAVVLATGLTAAYLIHAGSHEASLPGFEASLDRLRLILLGVGIIGVGLAVAGGWAISSGALRPIARMIETARSIALSRGFSRRVEVRDDAGDELAELGRTFNEMLASLDEAYRRQQRFVGDVSHELRTPLTAIQGDLQLLERGDLSPGERSEILSEALREARRLARLIDDLLALVRADGGPQPFRGVPIALDEVVMEVFRDLRPAAGERLRVVDLDPAVVEGERDRLKQLVLILVDNALRYTPAGGEVRVSLGREGADAILRVEDEGIGVTADVAARAFERFYRGEAAQRMDPSGTGLGLSIARWIVDRHGGSISLQARPARGTVALVHVPREVEEGVGPEGDRIAEPVAARG